MKKLGVPVFLFIAGFVISGIAPRDRFTWLLEVFPALLGAGVLSLTYRRFRFSTMTYWFILLHCYILFLGGHYTYAEVPFFDWIRDLLHQSRNNYDKVGHFAQGFVPAMIVRELFVRKQIVKGKGWTAFLTVCVCLSVSVFYEFLEWFVAILTGESADAFLGTQGYAWDTQSDMLFAGIGAVCMVLFFSRIQDRSIERMKGLRASAPPR